jgi:hypothetical protein
LTINFDFQQSLHAAHAAAGLADVLEGRIGELYFDAALWALAGMFPDETGKFKTDF